MNFNQICEEMKERIEKEYESSSKVVGLSSRYASNDAYSGVISSLESLENKRALNLSKLEDVLALTNQSIEIQEKFIDFKSMIDGFEIAEWKKIGFILTSAGVLNRFDSSILDINLLLYLVPVLCDEKTENYKGNEHAQLLLELNSKGDFPKPSESEKTK